MRNFLLEIGSEEIPAGYITPALEQMRLNTEKWFQENQMRYHFVSAYATPRRLTLFISDLSEKQDVSEKLVLGPSARISYDTEGNLTKAGLGFAKSQNVEVSQLFKQTTEKGDYLAVNKTIGGEKTENLLPAFSKELISKISFPKSMYWEKSQFRYARPIRWIVSLWGEEIIPFEIADVKSDRNSYGHPIRSSHKIPLEKADLQEYKEKLRNAYVIVDPQERKTTISGKLAQFGTDDKDPQLLETVTYLVESPSMIQGYFNPELLYLPPEVLITSMKHHQKYFPVISSGKLQSHFLSIHNSAAIAEPNIKIGNERVLQARLSDAQFFWKEDTKTPLIDKNKKLSGLLFQAKLGNYDKKVERIMDLSDFLATQLTFPDSDKKHVRRTAELCKSDLITEMVKEFPELQGVMGKWYAQEMKEDKAVCQAIEDHYLPKGGDSALPSNNIGAVVSLADKLDTIVGCFGAGLIPTGSEDPFALRRAGNGIIRIVLAHLDWSFSLKELLERSISLYQSTVGINAESALLPVHEFLALRFKGILEIEIKGIRYDTIDAVIAANFNDINDSARRAFDLHGLRLVPDIIPFTITFKRVSNILKQAREKFKEQTFGTPDKKLYKEEIEKVLDIEFNNIIGFINQRKNEKDYKRILLAVSGLRPYVDQFFDKVMVMVENQLIRRNRLALLEMLEREISPIADFSQLVVEEQ